MANTFDFVIVGGGTAGCLLASRLSSTKKQPSVLLIESGGDSSDINHRQPYERFLNAFIRPELDHGYSTTPQTELGGKEIPYARGKGLGGSSVINFMVYTRGSATDYGRWAELVGSNEWAWEKTKERFQKIESFSCSASHELEQYAKPDPQTYGKDGSLQVSLPSQYEPETRVAFDVLAELGYPLNLDPNSGDPTGAGMNVVSSHGGLRTTSASAYLAARKPHNLTIWTESSVARVILDGKRAIGVETADSRKVFSKAEVILCAGAIDTPKLLLLSGIGPAKELSAHNIKVNHDLYGVGKTLQDHCGVFLTDHLGPKFSSRVELMMSPEKMEAAGVQWAKDKTGPISDHYTNLVLAFIRDPKLNEINEFKSLDSDVQRYLSAPNVPSFEVILNGALLHPYVFEDKLDSFWSSSVILMNPQSRGSVKLQSSNPADPPLFDMAYMTHPYDRHILIEGVRRAMQFVKTNALSPFWKSTIIAPKSEQDEDIWKYIQDNLSPLWHANGSTMMGKPGNETACVDVELRVFGLENIRIADLSVCPITPNNHTQATAYLVGEFAAEKIIRQYHLD